jgi:hypothetical protein
VGEGYRATQRIRTRSGNVQVIDEREMKPGLKFERISGEKWKRCNRK